MYFFRNYVLLVTLILFTNSVSLSQAQDTSISNIYVNNQQISSPQDGSKQFPFQQLSDAFIATINASPTLTQANIYIAATPDVYALDGFTHSFDSSKISAFMMTMWQNDTDQISTQDQRTASTGSLVAISLTSSSLSFSGGIFVSLSNMSITAKDSIISLSNSSLNLYSINIAAQSDSNQSLIVIEDAKDLTLTSININVSDSSILQYSTVFNNNELNSSIKLTDISFSYNESQNYRNKYDNAILNFSGNPQVMSKNIDIAGLAIYSQDDLIIRPQSLLVINNFESVSLSDIKIYNQLFNFIASWDAFVSLTDINILTVDGFDLSESFSTSVLESDIVLVSIERVQNLTVQDLKLMENNIATSQQSSIILFEGSNVSSIHLYDHSITNNTFKGNVVLFDFVKNDIFPPLPVDITIMINNITVSDNNNTLPSDQFTYLNSQDDIIDMIVITEVTFARNNLTGELFSIKSYEEDSADFSQKLLSLTNISFISNTQAANLTLLSFLFNEDEKANSNCLRPVKPYIMQMQNLTVKNNIFNTSNSKASSFYNGKLFQISQAQVSLNASSIVDNIFDEYDLLMLSPQSSSIMIILSNFTGNNLTSSQFLSMVSQDLGTFCNAQDGSDALITPVYGYSFILDSLFANNYLLSSSLLNLDNGLITLSNNTLNNLTLFESQLIIAEFATSNVDMNKLIYKRDSSIEAVIFGANPTLKSIFDESMSKAITYNSDSIFFCSITSNKFTNIALYNQSLLSISNFDIKQSFINIEANIFMNLQGNKENLIVSIIDCKQFDSLLVSANTFQKLSGAGMILLSLKNEDATLCKVGGNSINNSFFDNFVTYTGSRLTNFAFRGNHVTNTTLFRSLTSVSVQRVSETFLFDSNIINVTNLTVGSRKTQDNRYGFITIFCEEPSEDHQLILSNNAFIGLIGEISNMTDPFIQISVLIIQTQQSIITKNMSLSSIIILPFGSILDVSTTSSFFIQDSNFDTLKIQGSDGLVKLSASKILVSNLTVNDASAVFGPGLFAVKSYLPESFIQILNSSFSQLVSYSLGALLTVQPVSTLDIGYTINTRTTNNSLKLNILNCNFSTISNSLVYLTNIHCVDCIAKDLAFEFDYSTQMFILEDGVTGNFNLINFKLSSSSDDSFDPFIKMHNSDVIVHITDVFYDGQGTNVCLARLDRGTLILKNSVFNNIKLSLNSMILIDVFDDLYVTPNKKTDLPTLYIQNTNFTSFSNDENDVYYGLIWIESVESAGYPYPYRSGVIILTLIPGNVIIENSTFQDMSEVQSIMVHPSTENFLSGYTKTTLHIINSTFRNSESSGGPVVGVFPIKEQAFVKIENTLFENNVGTVGNSFMAFNTSLTMLNNRFFNNTSVDIPRDIFLGKTTLKDVNITNTTFLNDRYEEQEGVTYGATNLKIEYFPGHDSSGVRFEPGDKNLRADYKMLNVSNYAIANSDDYLKLEFIGPHGQLAPELLRSTKLTVNVPQNVWCDKSQYFYMTLYDMNYYSFAIYPRDISICGEADTITDILLLYKSDTITLQKKITAYIRPCLAGEYNNSGLCQPCPANSYSLNSTDKCHDCLINMRCLDQSKLCPGLDFWNANHTTTTLYPCLPGRCPNDQGCANCALGYTGPLCNGCDFDAFYVEKGFRKCALCEDPSMSLIISILASLAYSIYQMFSIYILYSASSRIISKTPEYLVATKTERSYFIKSLLTYTQLISILYRNSYEVYHSLGLTLQMGNPSSLIVYGTQCSMAALGIQSSDYLYYQTLFVVFSPVAQFVVFSLLILVAGLIRRTVDCQKAIKITALYLVISNQPGIVNYLSQFITCETRDGLGYNYIASHPNWNCDTDQYSLMNRFFVIPSLVVWCGVVTVTLLAMLVITRRQQDANKKKGSLGVLLSGVRESYYFWSIVVIALKLVLSFLVYGIEQKNQVQIFLSLIILWSYQSLVRALKPYKNAAFNRFEIILINVIMLNIIVSQYLIDPANDSAVVEASLLIDVLINGGIVMYMVWKVVSLSFVNVLAYVEKKIMRRDISRGRHVLLQDSDPRFVAQNDNVVN